MHPIEKLTFLPKKIFKEENFNSVVNGTRQRQPLTKEDSESANSNEAGQTNTETCQRHCKWNITY